MLRIASGRFGTYCGVCSRQGVKEVAAKKASKQVELYHHTNRGLMTVNGSKQSQVIATETAQLIRQYTSQQNYVRTLYILVPGIQRPLRSSLQNRYTLVMRSHARNVGTLPKIVSRFTKFLRIRYLVLTGAIAGGVGASQTFDSWKKYIPDVEWMKKYRPDEATLDKYMKPFREARSAIGNLSLPEKGWLKNKIGGMSDFKEWMEQASYKGIFDEGKDAVIGQ